jgi:Mn-dependent DtxR family transcriptional regulator
MKTPIGYPKGLRKLFTLGAIEPDPGANYGEQIAEVRTVLELIDTDEPAELLEVQSPDHSETLRRLQVGGFVEIGAGGHPGRLTESGEEILRLVCAIRRD